MRTPTSPRPSPHPPRDGTVTTGRAPRRAVLRFAPALLALVASGAALRPLAAAAAPAAPPAGAGAAIELAGRLDRYLQDGVATYGLPGLSAVVVQGDEVVLTWAYGFADRAAERPMTAQTPVAIGSTGKGMTALAVLQLAEQGLVDLDAPVVRYLPDFTMADPRAREITLRQLLSMSAGLPASDAFDGAQDADALERRMASLATVPLDRAPGTGFEYANDGFNVAGLVVQRVSGLPFERYMAVHLFGPLGMGHTTYDPAAAAELGVVQGYGHHRGVPVPLRTPFTRGYNPAGMAVSSAADVGRYLRALLSGGALEGARVLSPDSVAQLWTPAFRMGETTGVGLGWGVGALGGQRAMNWTGGTGTSSSVFLVMPDQGLGVAVMANRDDGPGLRALSVDVATIALGGEPAARPAPVDWTQVPPVEPDRTAWDGYVGIYASPRSAVRVSLEGDRLLATVESGDFLMGSEQLGPNEGREAELVPTSATEFVLLGDSTALDQQTATFEPGPDGRPVLVLGGEPFGVRQ
jgi:CubicO group peptidase (beta-lactamase class C family)